MFKKKTVHTTNGIVTHLVQIQQIHIHIWTLGPHLVSSEGLATSCLSVIPDIDSTHLDEPFTIKISIIRK